MRELQLTPQARRVLRHLEKNQSITPLEALGVYGIFRLAARVLEIRKQGFDVKTHYKTDDNGKQYAAYQLQRAAA
jgi:hypothetical protein